MAAGGLGVIFSTFRFANGGMGFWGVMPSVAAPFRRPAIAQSDAAYLAYVIAATFRVSESIMLFALAVVGGSRFWLWAVVADPRVKAAYPGTEWDEA